MGLFWIDDGCWLGSPADALCTGLLLTDRGAEAVEALGATGHEALSAGDSCRPARVWDWPEVDEMAVLAVPTGSPLRRRMGAAAGLVAAALGFGGAEAAPRMTVRLRHTDGESEWDVSATVRAYTEREVLLSQAVLDRFVTGELCPSVLVGWWHGAGRPSGPSAAACEALLERWAAR